MGYFYQIDFRVTLRNDTSATESLVYSLSAGQLYAANGNVQPSEGDTFFKYSHGTSGYYADFTGGDLATAKGGATLAGDVFQVSANSTVTYVDSRVIDLDGLMVLDTDRRVLPIRSLMLADNVPAETYFGNRTFALPSSASYSLSALTMDQNGSTGGLGIKWYLCVNDTSASQLENENSLTATEWVNRTGVNDIEFWDGETSTKIVFSAYGITNNVSYEEIVLKAQGQYGSPYEYLSATVQFYTGDPRRSTYYTSGNWTIPGAVDSSGYSPEGVGRFLINDSGQFTFEDWNDGNYADYTGSQADPPFESEPVTPATADLTVVPSSIVQGQSATLSWVTTNSLSAFIDNGVGHVTPISGGSVIVFPSVTTTYTITADTPGPNGIVTDSTTLNVTSGSSIIGTNCVLKEDYIRICGLEDPTRFGLNRYINLTEYLPEYLSDSEVETFTKFFEDFLNIMFDGINGHYISAAELPITRDVPNDNDKYYTYTETLSAQSVTATTSADDVDRVDYLTSSSTVEQNLEIPLFEGELYSRKISILEKIYRLTELHDPDLIDIEYIQFFAKNLGYDVNINRAEIGTNLGDLTNQDSSAVSGVCDNFDRDKYLRFVVRNLPTWYKIKTTDNAIKVMLYSFGLIGDLIEYWSNDYDVNWKLDQEGNLDNIPDNYFNTPHFAVQIDIDESVDAISLDWDRRQKVLNAIESVRPINTVFKRLIGYADRDYTIFIDANTRIRTNMIVR